MQKDETIRILTADAAKAKESLHRMELELARKSSSDATPGTADMHVPLTEKQAAEAGM